MTEWTRYQLIVIASSSILDWHFHSTLTDQSMLSFLKEACGTSSPVGLFFSSTPNCSLLMYLMRSRTSGFSTSSVLRSINTLFGVRGGFQPNATHGKFNTTHVTQRLMQSTHCTQRTQSTHHTQCNVNVINVTQRAGHSRSFLIGQRLRCVNFRTFF